VVAERIRDARPGHGGAAEEALWHFPPAETVVQVRQLFRSRNFVLRHPATVARLLDRAAHTGARGLDEELADMERLWIRFWNPGLVLLALKARELRTR